MMQFMTGSENAGSVTARFEPVEIGLLRLAASQLIDLLEGAETHALGTSGDPALRRLLPDAYADDPEAAAEFRRFTADDLLERKVRNARCMLATLGEEPPADIADEPNDAELPATADAAASAEAPVIIDLDADDVQSWLRTLTDLRLTLAERLEIGPDGVPARSADAAPFLNDIYDWFGMVQESLVYAIDV
ncbi:MULTISPECIES: DUF2017 family protein [unclassified Cryobacterium]|uniref:DUF2017 family protein n=1 Tax=unclassified Cryobacterium TaxID=2649013 RepID=UPI000CE44D89|nr:MULTISPECIES: DUF2017 family protein [unclassified Cryobacterium]TFB60540.1 DUF2017 family protein [Cryobacterium sp. Sr3]